MHATATRLGLGRLATAVIALVAVLQPGASTAQTPSPGQTLPTGWAVADIGAPSRAGSATFASGAFTVSGAGSGVSGRSDQFTFAYRQLAGDGTLIARVASLQGSSSRARVGVMLRESLAVNAREAFLNVSGSGGVRLTYRYSTNGRTYGQNERSGAVPVWLKLVRRSSTVTASQSVDGVTWTSIGSTTISFTNTLYVGLAVTSRDTGSRATAVFSNVSDVATVPPPPPVNQPPAVSLSSPSNGTSTAAPATLNIAANASDAEGAVAQVRFYAGTTLLTTDTTAPFSHAWSGVAAGSYALTAVARDSAGLETTSATVSVTVSTPANQPPTVSLTTPTGGSTFTAPAAIALAANASDPDGTVSRVDFYAGATLVGSDTASPYAFTWNNVAAGSYVLTAVARDNASTATTSAAVSVVIGSNQAPTVSLTAPSAGATFQTPASVTVSATASDTGGSIAKVDFFAGPTLIGTDTTSPYSMTWGSVAAGAYAITAVAHDNLGATTTSAARSITVSANQAPTVSLSTPTDGATLSAPALVSIAATAGDADGTIARVEFRQGSTLLATDTASPYTFGWNNVAAGQYSITAVAVDNTGAMTTSSVRTVMVTSPEMPSSAVWVPSSNNDTAVDRYVVEIFPSGADPTVANPVATQDVGKPPVVSGECRADVSQTVTTLVPGTYVATVTAIGLDGESRSAPSPPFTR